MSKCSKSKKALQRFRTYLLAVMLCLMANVSCIDRPDSVLSDEQMVDLLVDIHRSEGLLELQNSHSYSGDEYQKSVMASVLVDHGVTRAQYDSSLMWYAKHLKRFVRVYSHVDERLKEEFERWNLLVAESREFKISEVGDSVELWTLRNYLVLDDSLHTSTLCWEVEADSNYVAGDTLRWSFDVMKLVKGQKLIASMSLRPSNGKTNWRSSRAREMNTTLPVGSALLMIEEDGVQQFVVVPDSSKAFSSVILNLSVISPDSIESPTFLRDISLKRYHQHD